MFDVRHEKGGRWHGKKSWSPNIRYTRTQFGLALFMAPFHGNTMPWTSQFYSSVYLPIQTIKEKSLEGDETALALLASVDSQHPSRCTISVVSAIAFETLKTPTRREHGVHHK